MKNHRFLWLRNRTTDNRKCEKARNIKEKRTIEMFNTASKLLVAHRSSASADIQSDSYYVGSFWADIFYDVFSVTVRNIVPARSGGWT